MEYMIYLALTLVGVCMGSFAGAQVWRLRARQLVEDKAAGEKVDAKEYKRLLPLTKNKASKDRSIDLDTGKQLPWYDLIPVISWLMLRGKSRFSGKSIGYFEPLMEVGVAAFFVLSYAFWPYELVTTLAIAQFGVWLIAGVGLAILFAYDTKWYLLPDKVNFLVIGLAALSAVLSIAQSSDVGGALVSIGGSVLILSGLYLALYYVSKGQWIGFGDIKLGLALALLLADWQLAFIALFAANLIGTLLVLPGMLTGKISRTAHVPFGPLLIAGCVIAQLWGADILFAYIDILV